MTSCPPQSTSDPQQADKRAEQAKSLCLRLLTARARTRVELETKLTERGFPDDVSSAVLNRLASAGLIDDADFAEQYVRSRHMHAGKGKRALATELRKKGVEDDIISAALEDIDPAAERQRAEELVQSKLRRESLADGDDMRVMRRLVGMLARRGYGQSLAVEVVRVELDAERQRRKV